MGFRNHVGLVVLLLTPTLAPAVGAQTTAMVDLGFMSGCWEGPLGSGGTIEEFFSTPSENLIVGTTRYIRNGQTVMFEFSQITQDSSGITLLPYPRGNASEHPFRLTVLDDTHAVFEAPEHDFPKRISYIALSADEHLVKIDDGTNGGEAREWRLMRVACPGQVLD